MTELVFVDANVFLYTHDPRDPAKRARAREWIERLWQSGQGRTSVQVLSEFYTNATRKFAVTPTAAWGRVESLFAWAPRAIDAELLQTAQRIEQRYRLSWWDSTIVAAAQMEKCRILLTEDLQDGAELGGVQVHSPFSFMIEQPSAPYATAPRLASLHRPRGRPRRATPRAA